MNKEIKDLKQGSDFIVDDVTIQEVLPDGSLGENVYGSLFKYLSIISLEKHGAGLKKRNA